MPQIVISTGLFRQISKESQFPWPVDCYLQAGGDGVVLRQHSMQEALTDPKVAAETVAVVLDPTAKNDQQFYRTAYFEAFPKSPSTFIRGEGASIEAAEEQAWARWQRIISCPQHEFERRNYRNGLGFCKHCSLSQTVFEPLERCVICNIATYFTTDKKGRWYCRQHAAQNPDKIDLSL